MTQQLTPPALPAVSGTIVLTGQLFNLPTELKVKFPASLPALLIAAISAKTTDLDLAYDYSHGDQIGNGKYWKGRKPRDEDLVSVLPQLVMDDQIGPAMSREVDAQFGKDPEWDAVQDGENLEPEDDVVKALTAWHNESGLTAAAKDAAQARWWAGRMVGRVYIPEDYAEDLRANPPSTLEEALEFVHVHAVDPRDGGPLIDAYTRVVGYWNRYSTLDAQGQRVTNLEVYGPQTFVRLLKTDAGSYSVVPDSEAPSPFADAPRSRRRPEYLMWHADRDGGSAITRSLRDMQDRLNVISTYAGRNDDQTGYRQLIVTNAEPAKTPDGKPAPYQMGPDVVLNLKGLTVVPEDTEEGAKPARLTPSVTIVPPLDPSTFHEPSMNRWKRGLLEKVDQLWTLNPETQVSGESKRQSRKPFDKRVAFAGQDMGGSIAWGLRAALMLAARLLNQTQQYVGTTFIPKIFLDVDAVNLDELRIKAAMQEAGQLTLVALLEATPGIPDAAKEAAAVLEERKNDPSAQARQAALQNVLKDPITGGGE